MLGKIGGRPANGGCVAGGTICGKIARLMVGTDGSPEVIFMTGEAIGGCIAKTAAAVAGGTIVDLMTLCQREKQMAGTACRPLPGRAAHIVAIHAFQRITSRLMVGHGGS